MKSFVRSTVVAAAFAIPLAIASGASAGGFHVHIGGGAHFGGGWHGGWSGGAHWGGGWRGPHVHWGSGYGYRPTVVVRGGIWVGGGSYDPYYYPSYYSYATPPPACDCGPSAYYPPVYPAPSASALIAPAPAPMPSFGVGLFAGGTTTSTTASTTTDGSDVGLFANLRISRGLLVQGSIGKTSIDNGARVDRRYEGALVWEIGAENNWAPYLLGGLGVETADTTDTTSATQNFGELGAGIRWAVSRGFHLTADIRAGSRQTMDGGEQTAPARTLSTVAPPAAGSGQSEDFTRFQLGAMIYF